MWKNVLIATFAVSFCRVAGKLGSNQDTNESGNGDLDESVERVGASVTQIVQHPYSASLLKNGTYICSAVILNTYWLLTSSKCFDSDVISSYVTHRNLGNYTIRAGSSYNNKGGSIHKLTMLINNFDMKVSGVKLQDPLTIGSRIEAVRLPDPDDEVTLGYLAAVLAWTPSGHIRVVNAPLIEANLCEPYTKMLPGHYICVGGVQDPNRHFCRKDNGGAVIQNNTLVALSTFLHTCAIYSKVHAFPKVASFSRWLDSIIWDEEARPTTMSPTTLTESPTTVVNATDKTESSTFFADPRRYFLTLPFEPINLPLEPAEDNSVIPRMSLYESYLNSLAKARTSTTISPLEIQKQKREWLQKFGKAIMMPMYGMNGKKFDYDYKEDV